MTRLRYNGLRNTLGAAITSTGQTSITFATALQSMGTNIPTLGAGEYLPISIEDEILHLTAYTSGATSGTITRGEESTTAATHSNGLDVVHAPMTADFTSITVEPFTATASQTTFVLANSPTGDVMVFRNGLMQRVTTHYTISGATITMTEGMDVGDAITVIYGNGGTIGTNTLDGLTDVDLTGQTDGDTLSRVSGVWVPVDAIRDRRWVRGSAAHAQDDEFNDANLAGAFVRVDNSTSNAAAQLRAIWSEDADSLSLLLDGTTTQDATGEMHGLVKPYALAVGEAIVTHTTEVGRDYNYHFAGLVVSDGTTFGSGNQVFYPRWSYINVQDGLWTGWNSRNSFTDYGDGGFVLAAYTRIKRTATSTWSYEMSANGFDWIVINTRTLTMTPSHIGFAGGQWGGTLKQNFSFDFLRVM